MILRVRSLVFRNKILVRHAQLKSIFTQVEKSVIKQLNDGVKPTYNKLHPNEQPELKEKVEEVE